MWILLQQMHLLLLLLSLVVVATVIVVMVNEFFSVRVSKHKLRARTGGRVLGLVPGPGNGKYKYPQKYFFELL